MSVKNKVSIAIDGPVGAGKSTIARECARRLGFVYVDTGALYRALGVYKGEPLEGLSKNLLPVTSGENSAELRQPSSQGTKPCFVGFPCPTKFSRESPSKEVFREALEFTAEELTEGSRGAIDVQLKFVEGEQRVYVNGKDYTGKIRTPEASMLASAVSANPSVRAYLLELQRKFARESSVIMDGRDIGTVVLPQATLKIFLTAAAEERAMRRYEELRAKGSDCAYEQVLADLNKRDYDDSHREHAPLKQADDAILVDTTGLNFEQSVEKILGIIAAQGLRP